LELGPDVVLVSSAEETAKDVYAELLRADALRTTAESPHHTFLTTGDATAFHDLAELFLGREIAQVDAVHVETGGDA
jgi:glutamate racemase